MPKESQWAYAARGKERRAYPWGNIKPNPDLANYDENVGHTTPVGAYPKGATPEGVLDMGGNVWEWCADWYDEDKAVRVLRGGSWYIPAQYLAASNRFRRGPGVRGWNFGFRAVVSVSAEHVAPAP